jgi:hypothetical protein
MFATPNVKQQKTNKDLITKDTEVTNKLLQLLMPIQ